MGPGGTNQPEYILFIITLGRLTKCFFNIGALWPEKMAKNRPPTAFTVICKVWRIALFCQYPRYLHSKPNSSQIVRRGGEGRGGL